jgi:hypothetical protein
MSAWIVSDDHITALIAGYNHYLTGCEKASIASTLTALGSMLLKENCRSVGHRYNEETDPGWESYEFPAQYVHRAPIKDLATLIKLLDCYEYQACECDDWEQTEAYKKCQRMRGTFCRYLPGYEEAPWGLDSIDDYKPAPAKKPEPAPATWANERPTTPDHGGMRLTPRDAMCRQAWDIVWYGHLFPGGEEALREAVKARTNLIGLHWEQPYDITLINERIPRGGSIEAMVTTDHGGN